MKESQTVTPEEKSVKPLIKGLRVRAARTPQEKRGTLCEPLSRDWDFDDAPPVNADQITLRLQKVEWRVTQCGLEDRLFISPGTIKIVRYDVRAASLAGHVLHEITNRGLVLIPQEVNQAAEDVGRSDPLYGNSPAQPYQRPDHDQYRLQVDNTCVPYVNASLSGR